MSKNNRLTSVVMMLAVITSSFGSAYGQGAANRGLWVGQATLTRVNEVSIPLDANNVAIAPDPAVATPTADAAQIRLILHVNGVGQVSLLKDVAVLRRSSGNSTMVQSDHDVALVTDSRIYGDFPPQPAKRIASAVFDFGDSRATDALNAVMDAAALAAAASVNGSGANFGTTSGRQGAQATAYNAAKLAANPLLAKANVATAFTQFLQSNLSAATVDSVAGAANPANELIPVKVAASNLLNGAFYRDTRGLELVSALLAAVAAGTTPDTRMALAQNMTASYADVANDTQRFLAGKLFGDMIVSASAAAARVATNSAATLSAVRSAVENDGLVSEAGAVAIQIKIPQYNDTRGTTAISQVLSAILDATMIARTNAGASVSSIQAAAEEAGRAALDTGVPRYSQSSQAPSADYNTFVTSPSFLGSAEVAAQAAAAGAVSERVNNGLYTLASLQGAARAAAITALQSVYSAAARALRTELPMQGLFAPGHGDPRLTWDIKQANAVPLGDAALTATLYLPANHPTNPFRHRRHPDHSSGFDIRRTLRIDFDGSPTNSLDHAGFGVDKITGTYREEIAGLHKLLGPQQAIGLKVEGKFELNRISLIDTLNAR